MEEYCVCICGNDKWMVFDTEMECSECGKRYLRAFNNVRQFDERKRKEKKYVGRMEKQDER